MVHWLYNITGDLDLLKLAEKIHHRTAKWDQPTRGAGAPTLPDWHNVNVAEAFREPATWYRQSKDPLDLQASYDVFHNIRKLYGQVPGGMFGADENARPGRSDPRQAVETCGMVEQMLSDELMLGFTADAFWGDHCENVAFNSYPAAVMPDFRSLRYLTAPNMAVSDDQNHAGTGQRRTVFADEPVQLPLLPAQSFSGLALLRQAPLDGDARQRSLCRHLFRQRSRGQGRRRTPLARRERGRG